MAEQIEKKIVIITEADASKAIAEVRAMGKEITGATALMAKAEKAAEAWLKDGTEENAKVAIAAVKKYDQAIAATEKTQAKEAAAAEKAAKVKEQALVKVAKEQEKAATAAAAFGNEYARIGKQSQIDTIVEQYRQMVVEGQNAAEVAVDLETALLKVSATAPELKAAAQAFSKAEPALPEPARQVTADTFGNASTGLSAIAGAAGSVGQQGIGQVLQIGADVTGAVEGLKPLKASIVDLAASATPAGVALGVTSGLIAGALALVTAGMERARQAAEAAGKATAQRIEYETAATQALAEGNTEYIDSTIKQAEAQKELLEAQKQGIIALRDEAQAKYDAEFNLNTPRTILDNRAAIDKFNEQIANLDAGLEPVNTQLEVFNIVVDSTAYAAAKTAAEVEKSAERQVAAARSVSNELANGLTSAELDAAIQRTNEALALEAQIQADLAAQGLQTGDAFKQSESATAQLNAELQVYQSEASKAAAAQNDLNKASVTYATALGDITTELAQGLNTEELNAQIANTQAAIRGAATELDYLSKTVGEGDPAYQAARDNLTALNAQQMILTSETTRLAAAQNTAAQGAKALSDVMASFDATTAETKARRSIAATQAAQDAAIAADLKREQREEASVVASEALQGKLAQIEIQGNQKVEELRTQLADGVKAQLAGISAAQADLAKLDQQYQKEAIARQEQYNADKLALEKSFEEDAAAAAASGQFNLIAELQRKKDADTEALDAGFNKGNKAVSDKLTEDKVAAQAKLDGLKAELDAFTKNQEAKIAAEQNAIQQAIDNEQKLFDQQEKNRIAAYAKADQREADAAALREQRLKEAQTREDIALMNKTAAELASIDTVEARQAASTLKAQAAFDLLDISIGKLATTAAALGGSTAQGIGQLAMTAIPTAPTATAFEDGGLALKPTFALLAEKRPELVIPLTPSKGLPPNLFAGAGGTGGKGGGGIGTVINEFKTDIHVTGSVDDKSIKRLEKAIDASEIKQAKLFSRALHMIQDGKQPT